MRRILPLLPSSDQAEVVTGKVLDYLQSGTRQSYHPEAAAQAWERTLD